MPRLPILLVDPKNRTAWLASDLEDEHKSRGTKQVDRVSSWLSRKVLDNQPSSYRISFI
jgi:hypothetical protein